MRREFRTREAAIADARHLRVVDGATGEISDDSVAVPSEVAALTQRLIQAERTIQALKGQITKLRAVDPLAEDVAAVLEHWREQTNHPRAAIPLDGSRADAVRKMLKLFTVQQLNTVSDVAGALPYAHYDRRYAHPGPNRQRRDDACYLFANERRVEAFLALAEQDTEYASYAAWIYGLTQRFPRFLRMLAYLGTHDPHGDVLERAVRWARAQEEQA